MSECPDAHVLLLKVYLQWSFQWKYWSIYLDHEKKGMSLLDVLEILNQCPHFKRLPFYWLFFRYIERRSIKEIVFVRERNGRDRCYKLMCHLVLEGDSHEYSFGHCFLTLEWNFMSHSGNVVDCDAKNILWGWWLTWFFYPQVINGSNGEECWFSVACLCHPSQTFNLPYPCSCTFSIFKPRNFDSCANKWWGLESQSQNRCY